MKRSKILIAIATATLLLTASAGAAFGTTFGPGPYVSIAGANFKTAQVGSSSDTFHEECKGDEVLAPGEVLWHFVLNQVSAVNSGKLRAEFDNAGVTTPDVDISKNTGGTLQWEVITPSGDTLLNASTTAVGGQLILSHVCHGDQTSSASAITTEIHSGADDSGGKTVIPIDSELPLGSTVHDSASLDTTPTGLVLPDLSTVTFYFFADNHCDELDPANAINSEAVDVGGETSPVAIDPHLAQIGLAPGGYSYMAVFASSDTDFVLDATSDCEPFTVKKGVLTLDTNVHDSDHENVTGGNVPLGSVIHDTAFFTSGVVSGFDPDLSKISFTFYSEENCDGDGVAVDNIGTDEVDTDSARSEDTAGLGAGDYGYVATFAGDDNYDKVGPDDCEPVTVDKGTLQIRTDIHDANHNIVLGVPPGSIVHDTATLSGAVAGFDPDLSKVTFAFSTNGTCLNGAPVANGTPEGALARSVDSAPLAAGSYSYSASFLGDANYNDVGPAACEPLGVFQLGKTMGFWGNKNGDARIVAAGGYAANAVNIGRGAVVDTKAEAQKILPNTLNACGKGSPFIFSVGAQTNSANCTLATGININSLNTLSAQTLALGYNIKIVGGYSLNTIGGLSCTPVGSLTTSSSVTDAFNAAVALINGSAAGGTTTQSQIGAMNTLLGCLNRET